MKNPVQWARRLTGRFRKQRILVVGDMMLDRYIYGSVSRISPEAPVPVVRVTEEKNMPGGAANVARNLQALGACAALCGVVGQDPAGRELLEVLKQDGIATDCTLQLRGIRTTLKTRILAERQQVVRVDWEDMLTLSDDQLAEFCHKAAEGVQGVSGVIITDYAKGAIRQEMVGAVMRAAKAQAVPVALDPKDNPDLGVDGITVITPNRKEAFTLTHMIDHGPASNPLQDAPLLKAAELLLARWKPRLLVVTLGAQGLLMVAPGRAPKHIPTVAQEVFDVSGAGDTFIATILLVLAAGGNEDEAAELANCAAGVVVGKIGTATCCATELLAYLDMLVKTETRLKREDC